MNLYEEIEKITPSDKAAKAAAKRRWDSIAKPLNGMGILEEMLCTVAGVQGSEEMDIKNKCVAVFCADNGIVEENVTQTGSEVTAIVAGNMVKGEATVANMAAVAGARVFVYDVGMLSEVEGVINKKLRRGSSNFLFTRAMTREETEKMVLIGMETAKELKDKGYSLIACGEMGIGNTTTSSAVTAVLLGEDPVSVTGKGAGLSKEGISHKAAVIAKGILKHDPDPSDPIDVLSAVGGFDIAAMCGLFLGGAKYGVTVIIDGLISSVAALLAYRLCPYAAEYMLASHLSAEPAAKIILSELNAVPILHGHMALGEGTGAVALMPLLDMAERVYKKMPTFAGTNIEEYKPL